GNEAGRLAVQRLGQLAAHTLIAVVMAEGLLEGLAQAQLTSLPVRRGLIGRRHRMVNRQLTLPQQEFSRVRLRARRRSDAPCGGRACGRLLATIGSFACRLRLLPLRREAGRGERRRGHDWRNGAKPLAASL